VVRTLVAGGTYVDPTLPGPVSGGDLNGYINALVAAFPDMAFTTERIIAAGDLVVLQWRMAGTNLGPLPGALAPTGGKTDLPGVDVITVEPDGIRSVVGYFDQLTMLAQLGVDLQVGPPQEAAAT
jgi:predicted ester cyclase